MNPLPAHVNWVNIAYSEMAEKRTYVLKQRADRQADTRRRITEAAVALHQEIGPAATQVSEVARRSGVQRATVYNHFPDDASLFAACSAHWRALHPGPDQGRWLAIPEAGKRLRVALRDLYGWYRETASMTGNVLRDAQTVPALHGVIEGGLLRYLDRIPRIVSEPFNARGRRDERIIMAARAAVDFQFWRALESLGDAEAAELGAALVEFAARPIRDTRAN